MKKHENNGRYVTFNEEEHYYTLDDGTRMTSPSWMLDQHFPFNREKALDKAVMNDKYDGMTRDEIAAAWKKKGEVAAALGSEVHNFIEEYLNTGKCIEVSDAAKPLTVSAYKFIQEVILKEYDVIGVEKVVFDPELKTAGTIDIILKDKKTGQIIIGDWKTWEPNKYLKYNRFQNGLHAFEYINASKLSKASAQLWAYHIMLHRNYIDCSDSERAVFHITDKGVNTMRADDLLAETAQMIRFLHMKGEALMGLPGMLTKTDKVSVASSTNFIFGATKTGKTTFGSKLWIGDKRPYFIMTDPNRNYAHVDVFGQRITSFKGFLKVIASVTKNIKELKEKHSCIVVEILSDIEAMAEQEVNEEKGLEIIDDLGFGKGQKHVRTRFRDAINDLLKLEIPITFIDHDDMTSKTGVDANGKQKEITTLQPKLDKRLFNYVNGKCSFTANFFKRGGKRFLTTKQGIGVGSHYDALDNVEIFIEKGGNNVIEKLESLINGEQKTEKESE